MRHGLTRPQRLRYEQPARPGLETDRERVGVEVELFAILQLSRPTYGDAVRRRPVGEGNQFRFFFLVFVREASKPAEGLVLAFGTAATAS